ECVEIKQHSSVLHMPTKWLKELILEKNFQYMENRMLEINFQNARCTEDTNKNKYVNKKKSSRVRTPDRALRNRCFCGHCEPRGRRFFFLSFIVLRRKVCPE